MSRFRIISKPVTFALAALGLIANIGPRCYTVAAVPTLFAEVHGNEMATNCGLNVTAFALGYFHKGINLRGIAAALRLGGDWEQAANMLLLKRVLAGAGLRVSAYKHADFSDIMRLVSKKPKERLAIIFLKNDMSIGRFGHYVVLMHGGRAGFFVVDIGEYVGWESKADITNRMGQSFSGLLLLVRPGGAPVARHIFRLDAKQVLINAGDIASGPGMLHIPLLLKNTSDRPISIAIARGTCFCFRGAKIVGGDGRITPGKVGKIMMKFKRDIIGIGNIEREVLFSFAGYPNHFLRVVVYAHMTTAHPPVQLTWYPQAINLGLVRNNSVLGGQEFTVLTPKGVSLGFPAASSKVIRVIRLGDSGGQREVDDFGRTVHEFVVDLSNLPAGEVDQNVTIRTTDKYIPKIVIPITGQVEK